MTFPITADDYGLTKRANHAIQRLLEKGKLARVSLLANGHTTTAAINYIHTHKPKTKIGAHLNLVEGVCISPPHTIPSLVKSNGAFYPLPILLLRSLLGQVSLKDIETEMEAQLSFLIKNNLNVEHLNTHQNTHAFMPYRQVVNRLAKKHHISHVRTVASINRRLIHFPIKNLVYCTLKIISALRYPHEPEYSPSFQETSIHPGTNYD